MDKKCVHCGKILTDKKRKYCNDKCKFWYNVKTPSGKLSTAQCLRMQRAGAKQRSGRLGVRYN